jgi:hypothetical protein
MSTRYLDSLAINPYFFFDREIGTILRPSRLFATFRNAFPLADAIS